MNLITELSLHPYLGLNNETCSKCNNNVDTNKKTNEMNLLVRKINKHGMVVFGSKKKEKNINYSQF